MAHRITFERAPELVNIDLPSSKSVYNRLLILQALSGFELNEPDQNDANDAHLLYKALSERPSEMDLQDAGTAMRFATAFFSTTEGEWTLKGTDRMHQRPIGDLVEALRNWGAHIEYLGAEGFPPLKVKGEKLKGGKVEVPADVSSQFISALMLIAPMNENDSSIILKNQVLSAPYIDLTLDLMSKFGTEVERNDAVINIRSTGYLSANVDVEKDWSSASFIYLLSALHDMVDFNIPDLNSSSVQGDRAIMEWSKQIGIESQITNNGITLRLTSDTTAALQFDFTDHPDLFPPICAACVGLGLNAKLTGLHNLHLKESDRLEAVKYNLSQLNCTLDVNDSEAALKCGELPESASFKSFDDHRIAMSFIPLASKMSEAFIDDVRCISKSFPNFIEVAQNCGYRFEKI